MIHQVFSNPGKVNQRGNLMERELGGWSNPRQHQDLCTNVKAEGHQSRKITYMRCVNRPGTGQRNINAINRKSAPRYLPEDDFLRGSGLKPRSITGGCKFNSDGPRLVSALVKDHPCYRCGDANLEVRAFEHLRGEIGVLCGDPAPLRVYEVHLYGSQRSFSKRQMTRRNLTVNQELSTR